MKVVCISNVELGRDSSGKPRHNILPLTIGKVYETEESVTTQKHTPHILRSVIPSTNYYLIDEDNNDYDNKLNFPLVYSKTHFVTQDVWREMQLNKLL
jgi:hypothetical protein